MNVLLYYPRLLIALLFRPTPRSLAAFQHWNMAQLFYLWNEPWHDECDSIAVETIRRYSKPTKRIDGKNPTVRRSAGWARIFYLLVLFYWPVFSLMIAIRRGKWRFLVYWNVLVNTMFLFADWGSRYNPADSLTLTHLSMFIPVLFVVVRTGRHMPDRKHLMYQACREHGIPTPRVFGPTDTCPTTGSYVIKPVAGFSAKGIIFTADPSPYVHNSGVIVQEVVRNPIELRRLWNTDTLGTIRMMTVAVGDRFELAGPSHIKIPVGGAATDNFGNGNVFAMIDRTGRLSKLHTTRHRGAGISHHPTTGIAAEEIVIPHYEDCINLAIMAHQRLAPHLPFFNADVTITEQGPMLIEINRIPGLPTLMFDDAVVAKFVNATAQAVERVAAGQEPTAQLAAFEPVTPSRQRRAYVEPKSLQLTDV